jgi:GNAT superfamily N-acetyltransferase
MDDAIAIRRARPGDERALAALHVHGWQWGYRDQLPGAALAAIDVDARARFWARILTGELPGQVWLAEADGAAVGLVSAGPARAPEAAPDDRELYALYVAEAVAGTPVGHRLLTTALAAMPGARVALWVLEPNARARRFYERAGFRADGTVKHETWHGAPLLQLRYVRAP